MKGKRHTTGEKIRILREVDGGRPIREDCQERNLSEATYHRWRKQFGLMEVNEARRLKELERDNPELKKLLAESLLKNRVLEARVVIEDYRREYNPHRPHSRLGYLSPAAYVERQLPFPATTPSIPG